MVSKQKMAALMKWLGGDCINSDIGYDGEHDPIYKTSSICFSSCSRSNMIMACSWPVFSVVK